MAPRRQWQEQYDRAPKRTGEDTTLSGIPLEPVYGPDDGEFPGQFPYTRGPYASMYRSKLWTMRMFAGYGTVEETNARFKELLRAGGDGLSTAFDMPTLMGRDSDDPLALGEVGRGGVAVDTLADIEDLFAGIDLGAITTSMTVNSIVSRTSRIDGRGGKTNSFCAWYSFRMSFCSVPPSLARGIPARSAWATNIAKMTAAGELIVIDVVISLRSMPR